MGLDVIDWRTAVLVPLLALLSALIVGAVIIAVSDVELLRLWGEDVGEAFSQTWTTIRDAYVALFRGSLWGLRPISETLVSASPLILAGLSVALGFRAGLFNIGAQGQMILGGIVGAIIGFSFDLPYVLHVLVALIGAAIAGAIWGGIPGLLRAKTGAHEVITTIMFNLIAVPLLDWVLKLEFVQRAGRDDPVSKTVAETARLPQLLGWLDRNDLRVHAGFILALLAAWFVHWLLFKSTLGYEFRAVGANPDAARYGGMNVVLVYTGVMAIAGALAGLAGANEILGIPEYRAAPGFVAQIGFDAIALALLGRSHPAGVVAAGVLFGALRAGGQQMQAATDIPIDIIVVLQALIIVFVAAPALIRAIYRVRTGEGTGQLTKGWAA
ncbi:MAG: ABC transporter permease [Acidimicrobiia bacterium]|nr:ABC transporter permease [Acidimicrobiia bacterium]MBT8214486.1 ABC transporter permease [Acidimicrobiia bacterium]NNF68969.1 ABC transporter permease [Acidimicrobiia bacterium]NNK92174.1 ABC transporter permease [Acidimicrobiia bacterium]